MVGEITVDSFLDLLGQSDLVSDASLLAINSEFLSEGARPESPKTLADELVKRGILTTWQVDMLLQGKHRGFRLGPYRILRPLGQGGMSKVFLAEHEMMHRRSAIKVLPSKYQEDADLLNRFHLEARAVAALDHPNIVRAYDFNKDVRYGKEIHYLVMEYVEGSDLRRMVEEEGPLDYRKAADFICQAALGLAHAHKAGFVHRDIKPANLLVDPHGVLKILDLGLATFTFEAEQTLNPTESAQSAVGTADYVSPEQVIDSRNVDGRADIYSLGLTFYFLLTGHRPFSKPTIMEVLMAHRAEKPEPISHARADMPMDLEAIIDKMAAKSPQQRYQTADELAEKLRKWQSESGSARTYSRLSALMADAARTKQPASQESSPAVSETAAKSEVELKLVDDIPTRADAREKAKDKEKADSTASPSPDKVVLGKNKPRNHGAAEKNGIPRAEKLGDQQVSKRPPKKPADARSPAAPHSQDVGKTSSANSQTDLLAGLLDTDLLSGLPPVETMPDASLGQAPLPAGALAPMKKPADAANLFKSPWLWAGAALVAVVLVVILVLATRSPTKPPPGHPVVAVAPLAPASPSPGSPPPGPPPGPPPAQPQPPGPPRVTAPGSAIPPEPAAPRSPPTPPATEPSVQKTLLTETKALEEPAAPVEPATPVEVKTPALGEPPQPETTPPAATPPTPVDTDALLAAMKKISIRFDKSIDPNPKGHLNQSVMTQAKGAARQLGLELVEQDPNVLEVQVSAAAAPDKFSVVLSAELKCPGPDGKEVTVWQKSEPILSGDPTKMNPAQVMRVLRTNAGKSADKFFEQFAADLRKARAKSGQK